MRLALASTVLALAVAAHADEPKPAPLPLTANNANELKQQYERTLKEFADSIDKVKDNPEAKEALEKARDEFKKGMEGKLREAENAIPPVRGGERGGRFVFPEMPQQNLPAELQQLQLMQQEMLRERMDAMRALQGLNGAGPGRTTGRLGIRFEPVTPVLVDQLGLDRKVGVVVAAVAPGSAAEKAGLKANDILLQLQGKDVPSEVGQTVNQLAAAKEGEKLELVVLRKGKKEKLDALVVPEEVKFDNPFTGRAGGVRVINRGMSVQINNGEVTASSTFDGGLVVKLQGTLNAGAVEPTKITIVDGDQSNDYDSLEKVPEKYRGRVEKLMNNIGGGNNRRER
jgi:hypothetical protein